MYMTLLYLPVFFYSFGVKKIFKILPTSVDNINRALEKHKETEIENIKLNTKLNIASEIQSLVLPKKMTINLLKN